MLCALSLSFCSCLRVHSGYISFFVGSGGCSTACCHGLVLRRQKIVTSRTLLNEEHILECLEYRTRTLVRHSGRVRFGTCSRKRKKHRKTKLYMPVTCTYLPCLLTKRHSSTLFINLAQFPHHPYRCFGRKSRT